MERGNHVQKKSGFKFKGRVLVTYWNTDNKAEYAVVELDPNDSADGLQHIYRVDQLEVIE